jgi:two-component system, response regulator PdtaR
MPSSRPAALIVEDQPFVAMVASDILTDAGFDTFHAFDAEAAARLLDEHPEIEVVVTEAELPGSVTGLELARRLSARRPDVRLVVTGSSPDLHAGQVPTGACVLRKPYASGELQSLVTAKSLLPMPDRVAS